MAISTTRGVLYVHSAPRALCPHLEWAVGRTLGYGVNFAWTEQPILPGSRRAEYSWEGPAGTGAAIASAIRGWEHLRFEVTEEPSFRHDGARWMHTPALGIHTAKTDAAGSIVISEDQLQAALASAAGDPHEFQREMELTLGRAWDEELESFRWAGDDSPVTWLHKVG